MSLAQEELFAEESLAGRGDSGDTRGVGTAGTHRASPKRHGRAWGQQGHTGHGDGKDTQGMGTQETVRALKGKQGWVLLLQALSWLWDPKRAAAPPCPVQELPRCALQLAGG